MQSYIEFITENLQDYIMYSDDALMIINTMINATKLELAKTYPTVKVKLQTTHRASSKTNAVIYITADNVKSTEERVAMTNVAFNIIKDEYCSLMSNNIEVDNKLLARNCTCEMHSSYSNTVKTITCNFNDIGSARLSIKFVVESTTKGSYDYKSVKYSDLTEITPILLFYAYKGATVNINTKKDIDKLTKMCETMLVKYKTNIIPDGYHEKTIDYLYSNIMQDETAVQKLKAGVHLYNLLMDTYLANCNELSIKLTANTHSYNASSDLVVIHDGIQEHISIKSYAKTTRCIKLKSLAWHRLILTNTTKETRTLPDKYLSKFDNNITGSMRLLQDLVTCLENSDLTRQILKTAIISSQSDLHIVNTNANSASFVNIISENSLDADEFCLPKLIVDHVEVSSNNFKFNISVRYKNNYPTFEISFQTN